MIKKNKIKLIFIKLFLIFFFNNIANAAISSFIVIKVNNEIITNFDIKQEDTLEQPQHIGEHFEAIVANPPFSAQWSANPLFMSDERFSQYGKLAPKSKADYAFLTHMIHHLDDNGTLACVLPHGALFRGGAEGHIREFIIKEKNYLSTVADQCLSKAKKLGSTEASVLVMNSVSENVNIRNRKLDGSTRSENLGIALHK